MLTLVISSFLVSCLSDVDLIHFSKDIKLDESLILPIGEAKLTINDILNEYGLPLNIDTANSEISYATELTHEFTLKNLNFRDSIEPFDKSYFLLPYTFPFPANIPITVPIIHSDLDFNLNAIGSKDRIDSILINSSMLNVQIDVSPDLKHIPASDLTIELQFLDKDLHINNGVNPSIVPVGYGVVGHVPVGSYSVYLNGKKTIPFQIKVSIKPQPFPVIVSPSSFINFKISFSNIDTKAIYGFFDIHDDIEKTYTIPLKLNDYFPNSHFKLANPTLDITATTNMGVDLNINIDYLKAYNSASPDKVYEAQFYNPVTQLTSKSKTETLSGPTQLYDWVTKSYNQLNSKDGETSNFFDIYPYPDKMEYRYRITSDPARIINFVTPQSKVKLDFKVRIPFSLKAGSFYTLTDTITNLNIGTMLDNVDSAILVLRLSNGLPLQANYRMTYWKSNVANDTIQGTVSKILDDSMIAGLTSEFLINAPDVDADGTVKENGIKTQTIKIGLNRTDIAHLKQTKFIVFSLYLQGGKSSANGVYTSNPIHLTTKNSFGVKLGVFIKANSTINLDSIR